MDKYKRYAGIDVFRFIAALLVIAIHISPLASFSETGDFILTRVLARVAVPFFLMTSGFFIISRYTRDAEKRNTFIKRIAYIYGIAIIIYLPVNLYTGYFSANNLIPKIIKDIFMDGTFYHLWYLPASIIGAAIAWQLVKRFDYRGALLFTAILYLIGLFGDSYYGVAEKIPGLSSFYSYVFQISDYTRNGLFFAPFFFVLGGFVAEAACKPSLWKSALGFGISLVLMIAEAIALHDAGLQRHDSMYLFLPPCMYFLFHMLLHVEGKQFVWARTLSLCIYIIHPMIIIAVRLFAKLFHLQSLLVENRIIHFLMVCFLSVAGSTVISFFLDRYTVKHRKRKPLTGRAWIEVNLENLTHNVKVLQNALPANCQMMAVVKANAYGHGAFEISTHLAKLGIKAFAVATLDEGIQLRKYGIRGEILILGYTDVRRADELKKYGLSQTLISPEYADALNQQGVPVKAHLKIDTGMHRLGIPHNDLAAVKNAFFLNHIKVCGIYTHLCCSDSMQADDIAFTKKQISRFYHIIDCLRDSGIAIPKLHIQSSYGFLNYPALKCDYIRMGIALYGVPSAPNGKTALKLDLRPVLSLKSKVILIRSVCKGERVGYGKGFTAKRNTQIAVISVGYGDGFPRSLSCGNVKIRIKRHLVPIIGWICMDQLIVDITDTKDIAVGYTATLIESGRESEWNAALIAARTGSISNELLCRMGTRLNSMNK